MKVDVIVIDSGCNNTQHENNSISGINLSGNGDDLSDIHDNIGHGSAVVDIILEQNSCTFIYIIKICDDYNKFSFDKLCKSLEFILNSDIECKLINISMGITLVDDYNRLHGLIKSLYEKGIIIISAYANSGSISYPAAFGEVIGVDISENCFNKSEYESIENSVINIRGANVYFRTVDHNNKKTLQKGTSFNAGYISGII